MLTSSGESLRALPWMTPKCWDIRREVVGQRRHSAKCFKIIKRNYYSLVFYSWKAVQSTLPLQCKYDILVRLDDDLAYSAITRVHAFSNALRDNDKLNVLYPKLRKQLVDDRTVHYNMLATSLYNAVPEGQQVEAWKALHAACPKIPKKFSLKPVQSMELDDGTVAQSYDHIRHT